MRVGNWNNAPEAGAGFYCRATEKIMLFNNYQKNIREAAAKNNRTEKIYNFGAPN